jgi:pyruvate,orthophosphate dikinase
MTKYVYFFGGGKADGKADMKNLLGGKGANLAEMTNIGLPVPAGFTITTEVCNSFYANNGQYPKELKAEVDEAMKQTEKGHGHQVRRRQEPAARLLPFRGPRLHARHDGHRPQHRPQ